MAKHSGMETGSPDDSYAWARKWHQDTTLSQAHSGVVDGKQLFPSTEQRQDNLIKIVADTCLELYVMEELFDFSGISSISHVLKQVNANGEPLPFTDKDIDDIRNKNRNDDASPDNDAIRKALVKLVHELREKGFIKTSEEIVGEDGMAKYNSELQQYYAHLSIYEERQRSNRLEKTDQKPVKEFPDPRASTINDNSYAGKYIFIRERGPKAPARAEKKSRDRRAQQVSEDDFLLQDVLRDMSRITIMPKDPQVGEDFFMLLRDRFPPKRVGGERMDRLFLEPWELKSSLYFDRTGYVVCDERVPNARAPEGQAHGIVSEIKVESEELEKVDRLSHPVYEAWRDIRLDELFPGKGAKDKSGGFKNRREQFYLKYDHYKDDFNKKMDALVEQDARYAHLKKQIKFPELRRSSIDDKKAFANLRNELFDLRKTIHVFGINAEQSPEWGVELLKTAYREEAAMNGGIRSGKTRPFVSTDLDRIGANRIFGRKELRDQAYADYNAEKQTRLSGRV